MESRYLNTALSDVALLLKHALLSLDNVDVFLPIVTSPHITPTSSDVSTFLTNSFPRVTSVDKAPNMAVALDPTIARISALLERGYSGSSFLALAAILHGVAHATRHQFVPVAIRGSCLVDDEDRWPSDPGYQAEHALFGDIWGSPSPTDPDLLEISHFTLYTEDSGDLYMIDLEAVDAWIESDEPRPFNLE